MVPKTSPFSKLTKSSTTRTDHRSDVPGGQCCTCCHPFHICPGLRNQLGGDRNIFPPDGCDPVEFGTLAKECVTESNSRSSSSLNAPLYRCPSILSASLSISRMISAGRITSGRGRARAPLGPLRFPMIGGSALAAGATFRSLGSLGSFGSLGSLGAFLSPRRALERRVSCLDESNISLNNSVISRDPKMGSENDEGSEKLSGTGNSTTCSPPLDKSPACINAVNGGGRLLLDPVGPRCRPDPPSSLEPPSLSAPSRGRRRPVRGCVLLLHG
mmetsp:Transcript_10557/g.29046  ORF Transcript_10557/g.29046 Transcript_10557/m.29046 type:complete len:272 (+) Transcript_10557:4738-5553(+)